MSMFVIRFTTDCGTREATVLGRSKEHAVETFAQYLESEGEMPLHFKVLQS